MALALRPCPTVIIIIAHIHSLSPTQLAHRRAPTRFKTLPALSPRHCLSLAACATRARPNLCTDPADSKAYHSALTSKNQATTRPRRPAAGPRAGPHANTLSRSVEHSAKAHAADQRS